MNTKLFWSDTLERAVKTFAQTLVALLGAESFNVLQEDWKVKLSVAGGATLVSILTSIASAGTGNSASLVVNNVKEK